MKNAILTLLLATTVAWAGGERGGTSGGNGGGGWVCFEKGGDIRWIELLDFFEAREGVRNGLDIPKETPLKAPLNDAELKTAAAKEIEAIRAKLKSVDPSFAYYFDAELKRIYQIEDITKNAGLNTTADFTTDFVPGDESCEKGAIKYVPFAIYRTYAGTTSLIYAKNIKKEFRHRPKLYAALLAHEAIYAVFRKYKKDPTSDNARVLNAHLHSTKEPQTYKALFPQIVASTIPACAVVAVLPRADLLQIGTLSDDGLITAKNGNGWGFINVLGESVFGFQHYFVRPFVNGIAAVADLNYYQHYDDAWKRIDWHYTDINGRQPFYLNYKKGPNEAPQPFQRFVNAGSFSTNGFAWVEIDGNVNGGPHESKGWGLLRRDGTWAIEPESDNAIEFVYDFETAFGGDGSRSQLMVRKGKPVLVTPDLKQIVLPNQGVISDLSVFSAEDSVREIAQPDLVPFKFRNLGWGLVTRETLTSGCLKQKDWEFNAIPLPAKSN